MEKAKTYDIYWHHLSVKNVTYIARVPAYRGNANVSAEWIEACRKILGLADGEWHYRLDNIKYSLHVDRYIFKKGSEWYVIPNLPGAQIIETTSDSKF